MTPADQAAVEAVARAIYDVLEGPVNNQDYTRQCRQWDQSLELAKAAIAALPHATGFAAGIEAAAKVLDQRIAEHMELKNVLTDREQAVIHGVYAARYREIAFKIRALTPTPDTDAPGQALPARLTRDEIRAKYSSYQNWPIQSFDGMDWAKAFIDKFGDKRDKINADLMLAWFCAALMRGYDERTHNDDALRCENLAVQIATARSEGWGQGREAAAGIVGGWMGPKIADGSCQTCHGTRRVTLAGADGPIPCPTCWHVVPDKITLHKMRDDIVTAIRALTEDNGA